MTVFLSHVCMLFYQTMQQITDSFHPAVKSSGTLWVVFRVQQSPLPQKVETSVIWRLNFVCAYVSVWVLVGVSVCDHTFSPGRALQGLLSGQTEQQFPIRGALRGFGEIYGSFWCSQGFTQTQTRLSLHTHLNYISIYCTVWERSCTFLILCNQTVQFIKSMPYFF